MRLKDRGVWSAGLRVPRLLPALAALAVAMFLVACGGDDDDQAGRTEADDDAARDEVACRGSLGIIVPITGDAARQGEEQMNWGRLAVERFNDDHGTEFEVVVRDRQLDMAQDAPVGLNIPQVSTVAEQFVADDNIVAVVGPASGDEVAAVGPVFDRAGMVFVSQAATSTDLTQRGDLSNFYRVVPPDSAQASTNAEYIVEELDADEVLVIDDRTSYSTGLADAVTSQLEAAEISVARESVSQDQRDFSSAIAAASDRTDVVFLPWQLATNAQRFGDQMEQQGKQAMIVGTDELFSDDFSIEGSVVSSIAPDVTDIPENAELVEAYRDQFGEFGTSGPPTYAAAEVVLDAMLAVCDRGEEPTRQAVTERVAETDLAESILGHPIRFDENGDVENARFFLFRVEDGEFVTVEQ